MLKIKLGVLASGRGSNLQAIMDQIDQGKLAAEVSVVISDRQDAYALERARQNNVPVFFVNPTDFATRGDYEGIVINLLEEHQVELVILAGYMRLVGPRLLAAYPHKILNIHPALLPSFPGLHGQRDALEYGVKYSGCTVHFVDHGMDSGPIILQAVVTVLDDDTEETLAARILQQEHLIYSQAIQLYAEGRIKLEGRKVRIL